MFDGVGGGGTFEATMHHAVGAFLILADAVLLPLRAFHELGEGLGVAFAQVLARVLPAEYGQKGHRRGWALVGLVAREEVPEPAGLGEVPVPAAPDRGTGYRGTSSWCARGSGNAADPAHAHRA